ncbi:MAG TPA: copper chaperone PCu(A)C [Alphaproteobacteria bacterium]|nr:copper chaperone PCu(A)C [Alphaproteobacteria bacterium]
MHRLLTFAGLTALGLIFALTALQAHEYRVGSIRIDHPWARATPGEAPTGAGFMVLINEGEEEDRLIGAEADIAETVEIHGHNVEDGVMRMRPVDDVTIPAGGMVALAPGAYHVMLIGLKAPLAEGDRVPVTLSFEKAGEIVVELAIERIGAMGRDHGDHSGGHSHPGS